MKSCKLDTKVSLQRWLGYDATLSHNPLGQAFTCLVLVCLLPLVGGDCQGKVSEGRQDCEGAEKENDKTDK